MPKPKPIGNILSELMARRGYARLQSTSAFAEHWCSAAGEMLSKYSRAGQVKRGVLEVFVANSTMLQEMTFQKATLIKKMIELAPEENIKDIKFKVGAIS